ncbi:MAG TPA: DUF1553 domain-containing protein [Gemmataceae bacterium]|nr:DUF1553 domain-containing protein [Gemmataceae bacterium]
MRLSLALLAAILVLVPATAAEPARAGPDWWSLQPLKRPAVPATANPTANPIDAFVRAKLAVAELKPAPAADRHALIRRVTFDLTGLPPTYAEVVEFLEDSSPGAYEKLIDRLLASPAYGERWARHWLDVVRFAESHGFEFDRLRDHSWRYRDYVIRGLNADKPYADFVREQLAGDVLPSATPESVIATGMLVAGPFDQASQISASAVVRGRAREDELEDMLATVSQTFLGVTINCARCHDHKFDPYTARDYYRLKAVFDGVFAGDRPTLPADEWRKRQEAASEVERRLTAAQERVAALEAEARRRVLARRVPGQKVDGTLPKPIARWTFDTNGDDSIGALNAEPKNGARIAGGRLIVDGERGFAETPPLARDLTAKTLEAWVALPTFKQGGGGVVSVQTLDGRTFDAIVFAERKPLHWMAGSENFIRTKDLDGPDEAAGPGDLIHIAITYAADGRIAVYRSGQPYGEGYTPTAATGAITFKAKESQVLFGLRHTGGGKAHLRGEIEDARLYDFALSPEQVLVSFRAGVERVSEEELRRAMTDSERRSFDVADAEVTHLRQQLAGLRRPPLVYAVNPKQPGPTLFLKRGDVEKPGDTVTPGSPAVVKGPPAMDLAADAPEGTRRQRFADWVVHPDTPLTWRVIVNRVWQYHFGAGLVRTPNDFGLNGERPSHPELLDWLAVEFRDGGGRLKALHRLILTSDTYRQSAAFDAKAAEADADNRLLWRFAPRRLEAEAVRDAMLVVSGKLNRQTGGPSARPFRVENFNSAFYILFDDDRPEFNRRAIYRMNVNSAKDPVLDVLDCPDPSVKTPRRNSSTTPLQALVLMNNPFSNRMTAAFADRVKREGGGDAAAQVVRAYRLALGRSPTRDERDRATKVAQEVGLKSVCWALLNASEFSYVK